MLRKLSETIVLPRQNNPFLPPNFLSQIQIVVQKSDSKQFAREISPKPQQ